MQSAKTPDPEETVRDASELPKELRSKVLALRAAHAAFVDVRDGYRRFVRECEALPHPETTGLAARREILLEKALQAHDAREAAHDAAFEVLGKYLLTDAELDDDGIYEEPPIDAATFPSWTHAEYFTILGDHDPSRIARDVSAAIAAAAPVGPRTEAEQLNEAAAVHALKHYRVGAGGLPPLAGCDCGTCIPPTAHDRRADIETSCKLEMPGTRQARLAAESRRDIESITSFLPASPTGFSWEVRPTNADGWLITAKSNDHPVTISYGVVLSGPEWAAAGTEYARRWLVNARASEALSKVLAVSPPPSFAD